VVSDDGVGLPQERMIGLGTQIVQTLVSNELRGSIEWRRGAGGGTDVILDVRLLESA
jgi:two-component system, sensor histidine kinase PdtaS